LSVQAGTDRATHAEGPVDAGLRTHERIPDTFHDHRFLGQLDALLRMARRREGEVTQAECASMRSGLK